MLTEQHAYAFSKSLLDPNNIVEYLNTGKVVPDKYDIGIDDLVDYPDTLGLFNNKQQRIEYLYAVNNSKDMDYILEYLNKDPRVIDEERRKEHLFIWVMRTFQSLDIPRKECEIRAGLFIKRPLFYQKEIVKTASSDFINKNVHSLTDYLYLAICNCTQWVVPDRMHTYHPIDRFRTMAPVMIESYLALKKHLEYESIFIKYERKKRGVKVRRNNVMANHTDLLHQYHYVVDYDNYKPINFNTLNILSSRMTGVDYKVVRLMHLDLESLCKALSQHHVVALDNIDSLPGNNLCDLYRLLIAVNRGKCKCITNTKASNLANLIYS